MNPKKLFSFVLFLSVCLLPMHSFAGKLDDIIDRHVQARGGSNWDGVESLRISGQFTHFSSRNPFLTLIQRPGLFYSEFFIGHQFVKEGFDGKQGWTIDPWQGFEFPRRVNRAEQNVFDQKAEFATPFFNYREKGHQVEFIGEENIDGMDLLVLKLTRAGQRVETWYLHADTYLEYKAISQWIDFAMPMQAETYFDDFREVGGLIVPFYVERVFANRLLVTEIEAFEINPALDASVFSIPICPAMLKLDGMRGDWEVRVELLDRQGNWSAADSTTTSIDWAHRDVLQSEIFYGTAFPSTSILSWSYNRRSDLYQLSVYNGFYSTVEVFEGHFDEGVLTMENLNSTQGDAKTPMRYRISLSDPSQFMIERLRTADQGETWTVFEKQYYSRL